MDRWKIYRFALKLTPKRREQCSDNMNPDMYRIFRKYRVMGACCVRFDADGIQDVYTYGRARKDMPVTEDTRFRVASVSKLVTALGCMKLCEENKLDLDMDVSDALGFTLRHPKAPDRVITLRMLLSHTAAIHDGQAYSAALYKTTALRELMQGDSFAQHMPGDEWEYSNLGAGIAGCVLEGITGINFDTLMKEKVFDPLHVTASFYPQRLGEPLADAWRVFPRSKTPPYDAQERLSRPLPEDKPDAEHHWALAHGNLCISAPDLAVIGRALMCPGYLTESSLRAMRAAVARFGKRADNLSEGIGTFILKDDTISRHVIYGHQGLAYGAVHGLFFDPEEKRGFVMVTSGASEARRGVLTDINADMIRLLIG